MKGTVLDFVLAEGKGVLSGDDGQRYQFAGQDWKSQSRLPIAGLRVDFVGAEGVATAIYPDAPAFGASKANLIDQGLEDGYGSLYRSSDEHMVFGVCGGLAHKFGVPLGAMRAVVFLSMFFVIGWVYFAGLFLPKLPTRGVPQPA